MNDQLPAGLRAPYIAGTVLETNQTSQQTGNHHLDIPTCRPTSTNGWMDG